MIDRLRELERAYLNLVFAILPKPYCTHTKREICNHLVVLEHDNHNDISCWRSIPHPDYSQEDENTKNEIGQIIDTVIEDIHLNEGLQISPEKLALATIQVRSKLKDHPSLKLRKPVSEFLQERVHTIEGSVIDTFIIPQIKEYGKNIAQESEPITNRKHWEHIPAYITRTGFGPESLESAFKALLEEVLHTTAESSIDSINKSLVSSIGSVFLPFSALGIFRGVAVWFVCNDEELKCVEEALKFQCDSFGLIGTLNTMYSIFVIEVITECLNSDIATMRKADIASSDQALKLALQYLYPSVRVELMKGYKSEPSESPMIIKTHFETEQIRKMLRCTGFKSHLIYDKYTCDLCGFMIGDVNSRNQAYKQLVEMRIDRIVSTL